MSSSQPNGVPAQQPRLIPPITIAVMGARGSGKTSFINMCNGSNPRVGMDSKSCAPEPQPANAFTLDGQRVLLVDMPSFDDTRKSDTDTLKLVAASLAITYQNGFKLAGVIYIHRITDMRFTGTAGRNLRIFRELCGDSALKNAVLVTNMWEEVSPDVGEAREQELVQEFFKPILDKGAQIAPHHNTAKSARDIIRRIMKNDHIPLQIQRELVDEGKDITDTTVGQAVKQGLGEQIRRHQAELTVNRKEMLQAVDQNDEETRRELQEEVHRIYEDMNKARVDSDGMEASYNKEKWRMGEAVRRIQEEARQERELAEAEYRRWLDNIDQRLQQSTNLVALLNGQQDNRTSTNPHQTGGSV